MEPLDPRSFRALAHPIRLALLRQLSLGASRVSDLAEAVGEAGNSVSFHLRQLEKYGFVRVAEPPPGSDRRESWWEATQGGAYTFEQSWHEAVSETKAAVGAVLGNMLAERSKRLMATLDRMSGDRMAGAPADSGMVTETVLRLSSDEARQLREEMQAVIERWGESSPRRGDPDVRTYTLGIDFFSDPSPDEPPAQKT